MYNIFLVYAIYLFVCNVNLTLFQYNKHIQTNSNGLAPDNLFFHGVACNCVKIQLDHLGLDTEFAQCEIQVNEKDWEGVRRKYWHGRDTYYLPIATWKKKEEKNSE